MSEDNRAQALEKLNAAFERAVEAEQPAEQNIPLVDAAPLESRIEDAAAAVQPEKHEEPAKTRDDSDYDDDDDDDDDDDWDEPEKKGKAGKIIGIIVGALVVIALALAVVIMEPWVQAPVDNYVEPTTYSAVNARTIAVGEKYDFTDVILSENEVITAVAVDDTDILSTDNASVTGLGEYFGTDAKITVSEKEILPDKAQKEFSIFGHDFSGIYNKIRNKLRDIVGIEKETPARTEKRVTALYEQRIAVAGLESVTTHNTEKVEASTSAYTDIAIELAAGEDVQLSSADEAIAKFVAKADDDGAITYKVDGQKSGETEFTATIGFWKDVTPEVYAQYVEQTVYTPPVADDDTDDGEGTITATAHENQIFVPTRAITYPIVIS